MAGGEKGQRADLEDAATAAAWCQDLEAGRPSPLGAWRPAAWCPLFGGPRSWGRRHREPMVGSEQATSGVEDGRRDGELELAGSPPLFLTSVFLIGRHLPRPPPRQPPPTCLSTGW
ncbi:hypothetical protein OsI_01014 [Oryza sativa Indica Group]|uniref:Uncharacterized protein n=1 Tax=Oryza sativa subsp. indica TaxID=39946 RepID=A2WME5_ORYSI|nr:hypothetical protein OsI_01014 [Oryza sativa Indica Group]